MKDPKLNGLRITTPIRVPHPLRPFARPRQESRTQPD
jgi:hypothetical protein